MWCQGDTRTDVLTGSGSMLLLVQVCATPDQLVAAIKSFDPSGLKPFQKGNAAGIIQKLDQMMGRQL